MAVNVFFLRVSSSTQQLESQFDEVWDYYSKQDNLDRKSIRVIEYKESGVKLSEEDRLGITDLKKLVDTVGVDCIYVSELSRVARTEKVLWSFVEYLEKNKIQLKCKNPEFSLLNEDRTGIPFNSRIMVSTFGTLATQEAIEKKRRFARGKARKAKEGKYNGGAIPYGYRIDVEHDNLIVEDEKEAQVVRDIYNLYEQGLSQLDIAKEMIRRGERGRAAKSTKTFTLSLVHQILTNELLTGKEHKSKGATYTRRYPQIITTEQFERCREIADKNNTSLPKTKRPYYSRGLIVCTLCGRKFTSTGEKGFYQCQDAHNEAKAYDGYFGEKRCENKLTISYNVIDAILWEIAKRNEARFLAKDVQDSRRNLLIRKEELLTKLNAVPGRLEIVENKRQNLLEAKIDGLSKDRFERRKADINKEKESILKDKASFEEELSHVEDLIKDIETRAKSVGLTFVQQANELADESAKLIKRLSKIEDDDERIRLIHKHIHHATVEDIQYKCTFGIHPEGKMTKARRITVWSYYSTQKDVFIFIPFDGKGGHVIQEWTRRDGSVFYTDFHAPLFSKRYDEGKYVRREKERQAKASKIEELKSEGYLTIEEMVKLSGMSESSVRNAFTMGKIKNWVKIGIKRFAPRSAFEEYLENYSPTPRPSSTHKKSK